MPSDESMPTLRRLGRWHWALFVATDKAVVTLSLTHEQVVALATACSQALQDTADRERHLDDGYQIGGEKDDD